MQVTESFDILMFSIRSNFAVDSAGGMLAGEVPRRNLFNFAAHIIYMRVSGSQ